MPIVDIEIVTEETTLEPENLSVALAAAAAAVFGSPAGHTWVRLRELPRARYAENGEQPAPGSLPVFVSVLWARIPQGEQLRKEAAALAAAIARVCGRAAEQVHIIYEPAAQGRIAFGGNLVSDSGYQPDS